MIPFLSDECRISARIDDEERFNRRMELRDFIGYRGTGHPSFNERYIGISLGPKVKELADEIESMKGTSKKVKGISFNLEFDKRSITFCKVDLNDSFRVSRMIQPGNNDTMKKNFVSFMRRVISRSGKPTRKINGPRDLYRLQDEIFLRNDFSFKMEDSDRICIKNFQLECFKDFSYEQRLALSVKIYDGTCHIVNFSLVSKKGKGGQVLLSERLTPIFGNRDFRQIKQIRLRSYFMTEIFHDIPTQIRTIDIKKKSPGPKAVLKDMDFEPLQLYHMTNKDRIYLIISKAPDNIPHKELVSSLKRHNKDLDFCFYVEKDSEMEKIEDPSILNFSVHKNKNGNSYIRVDFDVSKKRHERAYNHLKTKECIITVKMKNIHLEDDKGDLQVSNTERTCRLTYNWAKVSYQLDYSPQKKLV